MFLKIWFQLAINGVQGKVLVIGYWVRSSNNHSPKLPFLHISFVQRHLFLLPRNILCFGWMLARKNFLDTKVKLLKVPKTSKYTKIVQGWQFGHWNFKILTKLSFKISTKLQLQNLNQTSASNIDRYVAVPHYCGTPFKYEVWVRSKIGTISQWFISEHMKYIISIF